jgi:hypothetical protein
MRVLPIRMRKHLDYHLTGARSRWRYHGAQIALLLGVVGLVTTPLGATSGWLIAVVGLVLSVVLFVPDWFDSRRGTTQLVRVDPPTRFDDLDVSPRSLVQWREHVGVVDPAVDEALPGSHTNAVWSRTPVPLSDRLAPHAYDALRRLDTGANVFNGKVVRQDVDLDATVLLSGEGDVQLSETTYFKLMLTNYLMHHRVRDARSARWAQEPREVFADRRGALRSLADSEAANPLGVSTLAFTADGKVIAVLQAGNSPSSGGELAPSGSGSLDLRDVRDLRRGTSVPLVEVVTRGMNRELCEEAHLRPAEISWSAVLGHFRWMNKGGKPEYTGITVVDKTSRELGRRRIAVSETPFVAELRFDAELDLAALKADPEDPSALTVEDLPCVVSFPLFMCLRSVGLAMRRGDELGRRIEALAPAR